MTSVPPSRRRPVPTPPTARPRVAGLRKRADQGAPAKRVEDEVTGSATQDPPAGGSGAEGPHTDRSGVVEPGVADPGAGLSDEEPPAAPDPRSTEVTGLIEPGEDADAAVAPAEPSPRPRPTGRRKRTGEAVAPSDPEPDRTPSDEAGSDAGRARARSGLALPVALVVVAALLAGLGWWFQRQAGEVAYNQALVDSAGTTEVAGQAREAVEKAFSYNFADVAATEKAANELLVGKAQCQYNAIFGPVRALAPEQKLVVTVKAVSSGVTSLDGDRATVLLFLDQVTTRTTDNQSGGGIAMMRVGARKVDGRWKVDNMEMFGQTGDQAAETSKC
ncbi:hypothetical protein ACWEFJ_00225 [Actinosynnema sp. NPDC004786]